MSPMPFLYPCLTQSQMLTMREPYLFLSVRVDALHVNMFGLLFLSVSHCLT